MKMVARVEWPATEKINVLNNYFYCRLGTQNNKNQRHVLVSLYFLQCTLTPPRVATISPFNWELLLFRLPWEPGRGQSR